MSRVVIRTKRPRTGGSFMLCIIFKSFNYYNLIRANMGRTYADWLAEQDQDLVKKTRADDEDNKPLLNQINWIWVSNLMNQKAELNPSSEELLDWVTSGQIDAMRK